MVLVTTTKRTTGRDGSIYYTIIDEYIGNGDGVEYISQVWEKIEQLYCRGMLVAFSATMVVCDEYGDGGGTGVNDEVVGIQCGVFEVY